MAAALTATQSISMNIASNLVTSFCAEGYPVGLCHRGAFGEPGGNLPVIRQGQNQ
jgi:hypothetical protein